MGYEEKDDDLPVGKLISVELVIETVVECPSCNHRQVEQAVEDLIYWEDFVCQKCSKIFQIYYDEE